MGNLKSWTPVNFFIYFMPWDYFKEHVVPATNKALTESGLKRMLTLAELKQWMGILF